MPQIEIRLAAGVGTVAGYSFTSRRLWMSIGLKTKTGSSGGGHVFWDDGLIDTGAPLCVVPYDIHTQHNINWQPLSNPAAQKQAMWLGVPCDIGRIETWLNDVNGRLCGPFFIVAKLPQTTPQIFQRSATPAPILLGLDFFADIRATFDFQCHKSPAGIVDIT